MASLKCSLRSVFLGRHFWLGRILTRSVDLIGNQTTREVLRTFGDKSKRAEKKAKREQARIKAKENPVIAILSGEGMLDQMILRKTCIIHTQSGDGPKPLGGVVARIEEGRELESRLTLTRIALLGAFALAAPKRKGGERFVTIEGPDFIWCMEVKRKNAGDAVRFVAKVNQQAKKLQDNPCNPIE